MIVHRAAFIAVLIAAVFMNMGSLMMPALSAPGMQTSSADTHSTAARHANSNERHKSDFFGCDVPMYLQDGAWADQWGDICQCPDGTIVALYGFCMDYGGPGYYYGGPYPCDPSSEDMNCVLGTGGYCYLWDPSCNVLYDTNCASDGVDIYDSTIGACIDPLAIIPLPITIKWGLARDYYRCGGYDQKTHLISGLNTGRPPLYPQFYEAYYTDLKGGNAHWYDDHDQNGPFHSSDTRTVDIYFALTRTRFSQTDVYWYDVGDNTMSMLPRATGGASYARDQCLN
jgi:hypothetical protein